MENILIKLRFSPTGFRVGEYKITNINPDAKYIVAESERVKRTDLMKCEKNPYSKSITVYALKSQKDEALKLLQESVKADYMAQKAQLDNYYEKIKHLLPAANPSMEEIEKAAREYWREHKFPKGDSVGEKEFIAGAEWAISKK